MMTAAWGSGAARTGAGRPLSMLIASRMLRRPLRARHVAAVGGQTFHQLLHVLPRVSDRVACRVRFKIRSREGLGLGSLGWR
jgi:hypothetical protein